MAATSMRVVPIERLREVFAYDPDTGIVVRNGKRAGGVSDRYRTVSIDGVRLKEHRLIWALVHGEWPEEIDHINRDGYDNRLSNLRATNRSENCINRKVFKNNRCGVRGVKLTKEGTYLVRKQKNGVRRSIGTFKTLEEAQNALQKQT